MANEKFAGIFSQSFFYLFIEDFFLPENLCYTLTMRPNSWSGTLNNIDDVISNQFTMSIERWMLDALFFMIGSLFVVFSSTENCSVTKTDKIPSTLACFPFVRVASLEFWCVCCMPKTRSTKYEEYNAFMI